MPVLNVMEDKRQALIRTADEAHARYPQYKDHWNDWVLAQIRRPVRTKAGLAFEKGEIVLANPKVRQYEDAEGKTRESVVCYSVKNAIDTSVPRNYVNFLS